MNIIPHNVASLPLIYICCVTVVMGRVCARYRREAAACTDARIRLMDEVVAGIRVVKMYSWEGRFKELIDAARR